jgi:hypothetical protein
LFAEPHYSGGGLLLVPFESTKTYFLIALCSQRGGVRARRKCGTHSVRTGRLRARADWGADARRFAWRAAANGAHAERGDVRRALETAVTAELLAHSTRIARRSLSRRPERIIHNIPACAISERHETRFSCVDVETCIKRQRLEHHAALLAFEDVEPNDSDKLDNNSVSTRGAASTAQRPRLVLHRRVRCSHSRRHAPTKPLPQLQPSVRLSSPTNDGRYASAESSRFHRRRQQTADAMKAFIRAFTFTRRTFEFALSRTDHRDPLRTTS